MINYPSVELRQRAYRHYIYYIVWHCFNMYGHLVACYIIQWSAINTGSTITKRKVLCEGDTCIHITKCINNERLLQVYNYCSKHHNVIYFIYNGHTNSYLQTRLIYTTSLWLDKQNFILGKYLEPTYILFWCPEDV